MSTFNINLYETIYSLSDALDLVGVVQIHHGKRVAFMAAECGKQLGWGQTQLDNLFQAAILHDCGVSNTAVHKKLAQFEWEQEQEHCKIGAELLKTSPPLVHLEKLVLHHHTHWSKLEKLDLPLETKLSANCIYMADRVDILSLGCLAKETNILISCDEIKQKIFDKKGDWFHPQLVDAFLEVSESEAFWFSLEREHVSGYVSTWVSHNATKNIPFAELKSIVEIFSHIVDAKSTFTQEHSVGVSKLSRYIGNLFDLSEHRCDMLELAGLLHDIGKLRVPDEILEKNAKLSKEEYLSIQRHSFDTFNIIKNIKGLEEVAQWASHHHERLDGSGYPYRHDKTTLSLEARIIAIADVFQALAQKRPYRDALAPEQISTILREEVEAGKLDSAVFNKVENNLLTCWRTALLLD
ncbi:MAG: HD domain-containing protein [Methylococcaceae bacterium]|nr:HD domain-containing protein [Methylococcaceae bacterium]